MARFLLSVYQPDGPPLPPPALEAVMNNVRGVRQEMHDAGVLHLCVGLRPPAAAKVARRNGSSILVTDGPFAETTEHIGGFSLIDAPDLEAALAWARKLAAATTLPIEVRAINEA